MKDEEQLTPLLSDEGQSQKSSQLLLFIDDAEVTVFLIVVRFNVNNLVVCWFYTLKVVTHNSVDYVLSLSDSIE